MKSNRKPVITVGRYKVLKRIVDSEYQRSNETVVNHYVRVDYNGLSVSDISFLEYNCGFIDRVNVDQENESWAITRQGFKVYVEHKEFLAKDSTCVEDFLIADISSFEESILNRFIDHRKAAYLSIGWKVELFHLSVEDHECMEGMIEKGLVELEYLDSVIEKPVWCITEAGYLALMKRRDFDSREGAANDAENPKDQIKPDEFNYAFDHPSGFYKNSTALMEFYNHLDEVVNDCGSMSTASNGDMKYFEFFILSGTAKALEVLLDSLLKDVLNIKAMKKKGVPKSELKLSLMNIISKYDTFLGGKVR